jgi:hypothetical protein
MFSALLSPSVMVDDRGGGVGGGLIQIGLDVYLCERVDGSEMDYTRSPAVKCSFEFF